MAVPNNTYVLFSGYSWSTPVLGYFFADSKSDYLYRDWYMYGTYGFQPLGPEYQQAVGHILEGHSSVQINNEYMTLTSVSAFANLTFYSTGNSRSDIALGQSFLLDRPMAFYPKSLSDVRAGDVWLHGRVGNPKPGDYSYYTLLHELGHALGMKHGHEQDDTYNPIVLSYDRDSIEFSVMTYRNYVGDPLEGNFNEVGPQTFMMYDIAALQQLYGANFNTNNTDTVYKWTPEGRTYVNGVEVGYAFHIFMTIWDGGGVDTYDFSSFNQGGSRSISIREHGRSSRPISSRRWGMATWRRVTFTTLCNTTTTRVP